MMKSKLAIGVLVIAGLIGSPFAASATSHKHSKHSSMTTGANMKSDKGTTARQSSHGNAGVNTGPGTPAPTSGK